MTDIVVNGKSTSNWLEYFEARFDDKNLFTVTSRATKYGPGALDVRVRGIKGTSELSFIVWEKNPKSLDDIFYSPLENDKASYNHETVTTHKPGCNDNFTPETLKELDEAIHAPLYDGYLSIQYYLFGCLLSSGIYSKETGKQLSSVEITFFYIVLVILYPIYLIVMALINRGIIGRKDVDDISPMIQH